MKKIPIIILASARRNSDTKNFLEKVFKNRDFKLIDLLDFSVSFYDYNHQYPKDDEFFKIIEELIKHDIIVFATPVYWYAMSGLMKTFFDRLTDVVTIKKEYGRQLKDKSIFLLVVGTDKELPVGFDKPFELTSGYLHMSYQGHIYYSTKHPKPEQLVEDLIDTFNNKIKTQSIHPDGS